MTEQEFFRFPGIRSRITIGQVKRLIVDTEDKYLRELFTEILFQMMSKKTGWLYLTWRYKDCNYGDGEDD